MSSDPYEVDSAPKGPFDRYPEMMVISHEQLGRYTTEGWVLVMMLGHSFQVPECLNFQGTLRLPNQYGSSNPDVTGSISLPGGHRMELRCLIGRKEHIVIDGLRKQLADTIQERVSLMNEKVAIEGQRRQFEIQAKDSSETATRMGKQYSELALERNALREKKEKMEEDIGKLRAEFGAGRVREVLGY